MKKNHFMRSRRRERNVDSNKSLCMQNHDNNADKAQNCVLKIEGWQHFT